MKKFFIAIAASLMLMACGGGASTPVDKFVDMLDEGAEFIMGGGEASKEFEAKFDTLFEENADYVLTASDKKKIVNKFEDVVKVALKAAVSKGEIPAGMEELIKSQMSTVVGEMEKKVNEVEKFGDLENLFD